MSEARTGKRFPLQLPIRVAGKNGVTKNVSAAGIYLDSEVEVSVGSQIEFDLTLPAEVVGGPKDVHVLCTGHVVRVEKVGSSSPSSPERPHTGIACVIDYYKMVRTEKSC
jgi:hypothetical protein